MAVKHSCSAEGESSGAGRGWMLPVQTKEAEKTSRSSLRSWKLFDIMPVDNVVAFAESEMGAKVSAVRKLPEKCRNADVRLRPQAENM